MKNLFIVQCLLLLAMIAHSQKWENSIGQLNHYESSRRVIEHYDKGYLISAQYDDLGWLVKTDINGNVLWNKVLGEYSDQIITEKTLIDELGSLFLFGIMVQDIEPFWPLVIKLNACGEKQWCKLLYQNDYEYGSFIDALFLENGDLLALANMPDEEQYDMIFLICFSNDGEYKWEKSFASKVNYPHFGMRLGNRIQITNNMYIISGYVYSPYPNGDTNHFYQRPMYIGIDDEFNEQWVIEYGISDSLLGKALTSIAVNDSLFLGIGIYKHSGFYDAWAMYYNNKGEEVENFIFTNSMFDPQIEKTAFYDIQNINDSLFLAASGFCYQGNDDNITGEIIFDIAGNISKYEIRDGIKNGTRYLIKTFDGKYVIATSSVDNNLNRDVYIYKINENLEQDTIYPGNYTYDSLCDHTIESGVIDLAGCDIITSIGEIPTLEEYRENMQKISITASPNPSNTGEVLLEFENTEILPASPPLIPPRGGTVPSLIVYNMLGKKVHEERVYRYQCAARIDVSDWPAGMYVATIFSHGQVKGKCKVVVSR
nr:T9SS type A sorting domain-containing protein [Bacteroidota bacterium]